MENKNCSKYYIEYKQKHYFRGILLVILLSIALIIPVLNIFLCICWFKEGRKNKNIKGYMKDFWDGCFYNYIKIKVESPT